MSSLTLYCGSKEVGRCEGDLIRFIGLEEPLEMTAPIVDEAYELTDNRQAVLRGDPQKYPGAKIKFRIFVQEIEDDE